MPHRSLKADRGERHARGVPAFCPHRPPCAACPRFGAPGIAHEPRRALDEVAHAHGLPGVQVVSGATSGFRLRARLAIRGRLGSPKVGLFELGTHRVVHIPHCIVQHPLINRVAGVVRRALVETGVTSYSDRVHLGVARYLQVVVERGSQTAQVVLVGNCTTAEPLVDCLNMIQERLAGELHSLWFNANCEHSNTILGPGFQRWCGTESVVENFGGAAVHYPPGAFGQNNLEIAQAIIDHVRSQIPQGARVTEFYAGVGAIGLSVLDRVSGICLNEIGPHSLRGLELGLERLEPGDRAKVAVVPGSAGEAALAASGSQVVIADPPRKGLDPELLAQLLDSPPERFIYVSCGLGSFLEDASRLVTTGRLRLTAMSAFNLLPFTEHVETVTCFDRA
jgi:23S rRNA (uracil1939-C5)-methyltransferase